MFNPRFGSQTDQVVVTQHMLESAPVRSLDTITQRTPCFVDHDFDTNSMTVVPVSKSNWLGAYFGKFGTYEPRVGIVFETGFKHIRIYLYKYTIIIGQLPRSPLQAKIILPEYKSDDDRFDSRPQRFHSQRLDSPLGAGFPDRTESDLIAGNEPGGPNSDVNAVARAGSFRLAERIDERDLGTDQAKTSPE